MPRVKGQFDVHRQREAFEKIVRKRMIDMGIGSMRELAARLGIPERQLYHRMRWETHWTLEELWRLIHVLRPTADEIVTMLSIETAKEGAA